MAKSTALIDSEFNNPNLEPIFSAGQIQDRINELGVEIARDYAGRNPLFIGILNGACFFLTDLVRAVDIPLRIQFMEIASYGASPRTSGEVRIIKDLNMPVEGLDVLVVEDIVETGLTLSYLLANLHARGAASVKLVALLDKHESREREVEINYLGFAVPDAFFVGYGLDFAERYRNLPFIAILKDPEDPVTRLSKPGLLIPSI
ncbi:MAG TPA: hypoxanthine phosphoribosyltransferase [Nitrososphaera sp.]|nr:hypoxanthine phosphoribosyltransferase [Nitrososphaera sp.]